MGAPSVHDTSRFDVWPEGQDIQAFAHPMIKSTRFADADRLRPPLVAACEAHVAGVPGGLPGSGGAKAYHLERWGLPAAEALAARALAFVRRGWHPGAWLIQSWANVMPSGEYGQPHSHVGASLGVVYFLDLGTVDPANPHNGRFAFVDPRLEACCHEEPERLSRAVMPVAVEGLMFGFPSQLVHFVHLYRGDRPRITVAGNFGFPASPQP